MTMTTNDAKIAIGMMTRGDKQHDVAAWFGENQARIAEAMDGKFGTTEAAPANSLPPKGPPGIKGRRLVAFAEKALEAIKSGDSKAAQEALEAGLKRYNLNET